jgi:quinol monooxygenase YgiN
MAADLYGQTRPPEYGMPAHAQAEPEKGMPATGAVFPGAEIPSFPADLAASFGVGFGAASRKSGGSVSPSPGVSVKPSPSIYGLLTVFTLLDGSGEAFDKLAEETVGAVQRNEPDTLIFVCHGVKSAPLQRIVYELYRDEVAFAEHQRQPHMERFATERQPLVLATNVIELSVNAAKVAPLPTAFR